MQDQPYEKKKAQVIKQNLGMSYQAYARKLPFDGCKTIKNFDTSGEISAPCEFLEACKVCGTLWQRDVNATVNIMSIAISKYNLPRLENYRLL